MNRAGALFLFLIGLLVGGAAAAQPARHMDVRLVPETNAALSGSTVNVAFVMHPQPGWHGYWRNPGDAGAEPRVAWHLPEGWSAEPLQYPVPGRLLVAGLMNYVFERDYALLATLHVPAGAELGATFPVDARLDYLVCTDEVCVPETAMVTANIVISAPGAPNPAFLGYRQALPRPLGPGATFETVGGRVRIAIPLPAASQVAEPYFFAGTLDAVAYSAAQSVSRNGDTLIVETGAGPRAAALPEIEGVLQIGNGTGLALTARRGAVPAAGTPIGTTGGGGGDRGGEPGLLWAFLGALLGGLILNVMPCVFPILSLKALSLARAGETANGARREALAYAAGVIATCVALGGLLLALKASGAAAGWAFQLQDPRVILLLLLLVTAIALGLAGLFALPVIAAGDRLTRSEGLRGAFFTGALAAFVATPCTGPFMGAALGAALILPAVGALLVFAGLGLGLALPFLLLGFVPAIRRWLPRPGAWMDMFRHVLAVPMLVTALGLAWILGRQAGVNGMAIGLAASLLLALGLWWSGRRQAALKSGAWWPMLVALIGAAALIAIVPRDAAMATAPGEAGAARFDEARLADLRKAGRPIFLYFTADWCLTCKVNEKAAIERAEVSKAFADKHVVVMVGDWTRGDPAISRFLQAHGRSGVPFYLFYPAGGKEPRELPQILTPGLLAGLS